MFSASSQAGLRGRAMIVDTTLTTTERTLSNRLSAHEGFCLACHEHTLERMDNGDIRCYSCESEMRCGVTVSTGWLPIVKFKTALPIHISNAMGSVLSVTDELVPGFNAALARTMTYGYHGRKFTGKKDDQNA